MNISGNYKLAEHTPFGDRETLVTINNEGNMLTGKAVVDAGPGQTAEVGLTEVEISENGFSFLISQGGMPRRYSAKFEGNNLKGEMKFEGTGELAGIVTPFDGEKI